MNNEIEISLKERLSDAQKNGLNFNETAQKIGLHEESLMGFVKGNVELSPKETRKLENILMEFDNS